MKIKLTLLGLVLLVFVSIPSFAKFVTIETASQVAENFYKSQFYKMYGSIPTIKAKTINADWLKAFPMKLSLPCATSGGGYPNKFR